MPSGAAGKLYIKEMTRLIQIWTEDSKPLSGIALKLLMVMPAVLLQKPCRKSTAKQHTQYLKDRMKKWEEGRFSELMLETRSIQQKIRQEAPRNNHENVAKRFAKLMMQGKVHAALRLLDQQQACGILNASAETLEMLKKLHPDGKQAKENILLEGEVEYFDPVIFSNIDEASIAKAATKTRGAAGPSGMDADGWRRILISKNYGDIGKDLREAVAGMTRKMCCQELSKEEQKGIEAYTACRLIPALKQPSGVRPIGIGEVLRRIIGKSIVAEIKTELARMCRTESRL